MEDSIIIGGGIAGLTAAYRLRRAGKRVKCLEALATAGGCVKTDRTRNFHCERGAQNFLEADGGVVHALAKALAIADQIETAANTANFLSWNNRIWPVPQAVPRICSLRGLARGLLELCIPPAPTDVDVSVAAWGRRRFGKEISQRLLEPMLASNCGGDPERLSALAACPAGTALERRYGSVILGSLRQRQAKREIRSFKYGMGTLSETLAREIGTDLRLNSEVVELTTAGPDGYRLSVRDQATGTIDTSLTARSIVLATPAPVAANMLVGLDAELADLLAQIPYAALTSVWVGYARKDLTEKIPPGYGVLCTPCRESIASGCIFCSSLFPGAAPSDHVLLRLMFGGRTRPQLNTLGDDDLISLARLEINSLFGISRQTEPAFVHLARQPLGLPQYELGHPQRLQKIDARVQRLPGLYLTGNAYRGIPVSAVIADAGQVARRILEYY